MVWLYYITAVWPPQCSVTVGGATQGSLSSLWACRSRDGRGYQDLSLDFLLTLLCALNECWTLIIHISSFGPKNSEVYFIMGLTSDPNYRKLEQWYKSSAGNLNMRQMFDEDQDRFNKFRWNTWNALPLRASCHTSTLAVHLVFLSCITFTAHQMFLGLTSWS